MSKKISAGIAGIASRVTEITHAGFIWSEQYNNLRCCINNWLVLQIQWTSGEGYGVSVGAVKYKARFEDREQAAQFAVSRAKGLLLGALQRLEEEGQQG